MSAIVNIPLKISLDSDDAGSSLWFLNEAKTLLIDQIRRCDASDVHHIKNLVDELCNVEELTDIVKRG